MIVSVPLYTLIHLLSANMLCIPYIVPHTLRGIPHHIFLVYSSCGTIRNDLVPSYIVGVRSEMAILTAESTNLNHSMYGD